MKFIPTPIEGLFEIQPERFEDSRGSFFRAWCLEEMEQIGHTGGFVQHNHSYNKKAGTVRGMHFQNPPFAEVKLVRCVRGAVYDVAVDLRKGSGTFLQSFGLKLDSKLGNAIYIPAGFAHGFQSLEDDSELLYFHSEYYKPSVESGINYSDKSLNIDWPLELSVISARDRNLPLIDKTRFQGLEI